jgi:hypothetical protein
MLSGLYYCLEDRWVPLKPLLNNDPEHYFQKSIAKVGAAL